MKIQTSTLVKVALLAALTAIGAWIVIPLPFTEVPVTLQVFFVLLAGALLGPLFGALSQIIYLLLGILGLPVFAGGASGIGVIAGPTGGYLIGFILAAFFIGLLIQFLGRKFYWYLLAMLLGILIIYILGVLQLACINQLSLVKAILIGAAPFIAVDIIKAVLAALLAERLTILGLGIAKAEQTNT
jgi:biotin transport system substrate-specific component